ncbi:MAG TPA: nucleotide sugar dehydrogenase [Polyangia bacterium]|nr:nucleotide sugar dehydrogenase [Polyangia bacterium]
MAFERQKIVVIGMGYVGLPAAILLAKAGHEVVGVDVNEKVIKAVNDGILHIDEVEFEAMMASPEVRANLRGTRAVEPADAFLIAVPTPLEATRKIADLSMVRAACESLVPHLRRGALVVLESTVPPLTCKNVLRPIIEKSGLKVGADIRLAHCPERILPGRVFHEIVHNDRIIGGVDAASTEAARKLYATIVEGQLIPTDDVTAELCKLMENTYRDVNIALANELASVCERLGVDVHHAIDVANRHPRVDILRPGIGVGGHCIAIDPWFITEADPESSVLIPTARRINDSRPGKIAALIRQAVADVGEPRIACLGATYKPDTYDLRESPAIEIFHMLRKDGYDAQLFDPLTREFPVGSLAEAARGCDLMVLLVPHKRLKAQLAEEWPRVGAAMRRPHIVDVSGGALRRLSAPPA